MAKKKRPNTNDDRATETKAKKRRGGRKPGEWKLLTPEKLRAYRDENKISRARLAEALGVSSTSVQNWETGAVASMKIQQRLAELIAAGPSAIVPTRKSSSLWDTSRNGGDAAAVAATGTIVTGYVQTSQNLGSDDLVTLIRAIRQALR